MVRKRNMNKKRSQVAHYVKCELLVARRDPWRYYFHSLHSCVAVVCLVLVVSFIHPVCALCRCLFHLFHFIWCRFEICVLCVYYCIFQIPPPNGVLFVLFTFRSFNCSVRLVFFSVCLFFFLFCCCSLVFSLLCVLAALFVVVVICNRERIYVVRTSSHRYKWNAFRLYEFLPFIARMQYQWINGNICVTCSSAADE